MDAVKDLSIKCASVDSAGIKNIRQVAWDLDDQNLWVLVAGLELRTGAAFDPIRNCFIFNQWGERAKAEHTQPVRNLRKKCKDMASGPTPAVEPQTTDTDTPMHEEAPHIDLESLGLEYTYSLYVKKLKVLRKRVGAPRWVRAVTKLLKYWGTH